MANKSKPGKPYPEFPLYAHASGKWAKRIGHKIHYFGKWDNPEQALRQYLEALPYLKSGIQPPTGGGGYTIGMLCSDYYEYQSNRVKTGEIGARHLYDIDEFNRYLIGFFGTARNVETITPVDFSALRKKIAGKYSLSRLTTYVVKTKAIFKWAHAARKINTPADFGLHFTVPSKASRKKERQSKPKRMFTPEECCMLIDAADYPMKAFVLLALNGGFGQADIAGLQFRHVDLDRGWIDYPRSKTAVEREVPLWPETVQAIRKAIELRPANKEGYDNTLFVTCFGVPWVRYSTEKATSDAVTQGFLKLKTSVGITGKHKGFYAFRHTFRTIADECKDQPAVFHIMGHSDGSIAETYRELIAPERLRHVVNHVRNWYLPGNKKISENCPNP